jgi:hypothetical protein
MMPTSLQQDGSSNMWAITPKQPHFPVGARRIKPGWDLAAGETMILGENAYQPGYVLDKDGVTVRAPTTEDAAIQEAKEAQDEQAKTAKLFDSDVGLALVEELWTFRQETGKTGGLTKEEFKASLVSRYASPRPKT